MNYAAPQSIAEAVAALAADPGVACALAGGTDLIVQMQAGRRHPGLVIDLKRIAELNEVRSLPDGSWRLGAAVPAAALVGNAALATAWPGVTEAVDLIGSMQVQSRATPAGNLCNASPAADSVPALIAAGATVEIASAEGLRFAPVETVPVGPGRTSLEAGEIVTAILLPPRPARAADAYLRLIPRSEMDIAIAGAGVSLELDDSGTCVKARVALGAVAPTVRLAPLAAAALIGTRLDDAALEAAAGAARAMCDPIDDKRGTAAYRTRMAGVLVKRAARLAQTRAMARG